MGGAEHFSEHYFALICSASSFPTPILKHLGTFFRILVGKNVRKDKIIQLFPGICSQAFARCRVPWVPASLLRACWTRSEGNSSGPDIKRPISSLETREVAANNRFLVTLRSAASSGS